MFVGYSVRIKLIIDREWSSESNFRIIYFRGWYFSVIFNYQLILA